MPKINLPLISVIMNCHNGARYLKQSIKSLLNQKYNNWELIFWDNKSTDSSKKILLSFKDKRIKYFKSKNFLSLYKSRNLAIKKAKGKYVSFLDTDDWWASNKLKDQVSILEKKKINFVYSNFYKFDNRTKTKKINFQSILPNKNTTQSLLNNYNIGILSVMIKKKIFDHKKFDEKYNIIGDFDFFIKLSLEEEFICIQKPLAYYRIHEKNFSRKIKIYYKEFKIWLDKNENKFKKLNYSLLNLKLYYLKLKIKYLLNYVFQQR